jgi:hypothetical protein
MVSGLNLPAAIGGILRSGYPRRRIPVGRWMRIIWCSVSRYLAHKKSVFSALVVL